MKYKNIHNLVIEGPDGVGKSTLIKNIFKKYNYRYMCYHRGEISNKFYAKKYNRPYFVTQNNLPFLYIVLTCEEEELKNRINKRHYNSENERLEELEKVKDNKLFKQTAEEMTNDYDIVFIDTTKLNENEVLEKVSDILNNLNLNYDKEMSTWNEMYDIACKKYNLKFNVKENQPYINDIPMMVESTLHNGVYETYSDKRYPDNLLYSLAYDKSKIKLNKKEFDFVYIINSKIKRRPEIYEYYDNFIKNEKTCLISDNPLIEENKLLIRTGRIFKEKFIEALSKANATVYCSRDLSYLNLQTARLYESILAENIIFVDKLTDLNCDILKQIYGMNDEIINLLYVTPETICENYNKIISNESTVKYIINKQNEFYNNLIKNFEENLKNNKIFKI